MTDRWSLASLLGPVDTEAFFARHWQQAPLHVERGDPAFFAALATRAQVDHLIAINAESSDFPISVIGGRVAATAAAAAAAPRSHWTAERVYQRIAKGATVRLGNVRRYLPEVARLSAALEAELCTDIAVNLYLTPPESRAFSAHFDNHDVFILQVEGEKRWCLFAPPEDLPLEVTFRGRLDWLRRPLPYESSLKKLPLRRSSREIRLRAGDMLYVPRGHVHEVATGDAASLHLTVAAPVVTWYEVAVHALLATARRARPLRAALPPRWASEPAQRAALSDKATAAVEAIRDALDPDDLRESLEKMADQFVYSRHVPWHDGAADAMRSGELDIRSELGIRPGLACSLRVVGTELVLMFSGQSVRLPIRVESMVRYIIENPIFQVGDLPSQLSDKSRLVLARALLEKGLLTFAGPR